MPYTLEENARAVLLPAFDSLTLSDEVLRFLDQGGVSILLGESREEYVARSMSPSRRRNERAEDFIRVTEAARRRSGHLLAAVDQEPGGICRLHDLARAFPTAEELSHIDPPDLETLCHDIACAASAMGINVFLAPVLDTLSGSNPWLYGRTLSRDPLMVAQAAAAFIRGVQAAGVATCSKHFPGYRSTTGDPAIDADAICDASIEEIEAGWVAFQAAIDAGTEMMMVGPAPVPALGEAQAALRSAPVIGKLVETLGFGGIVMADDLDSKATLRGAEVASVAIEAINAGCHYLLLADTASQLGDVANALVEAVRNGDVAEDVLAVAADRVRKVADRYDKLKIV